MSNIAYQAVACCTLYGFFGLWLPEMAKLLPVVHKRLRKGLLKGHRHGQ